MDMKDKKVLVFGSGKSGVGASRLLIQVGAEVVLFDGNEKLNGNAIKIQIIDGVPEDIAKEAKVEVVLGTFPSEIIGTLDYVVMSPGVPTDLSEVNAMRDAGIPIWGEIELAYQFGDGDILAITGTNGKTTTTALLGEIMKDFAGTPERVFVVGNIGNPYTEYALLQERESITVAEMSSFQLETIHGFKPQVSAILNISPDHLNRHHTMDAYIAAKMDIAKNQTAENTCVLNYEDEVTRNFGEKTKASVLYFSSQRTLDRGIFLDKDLNIIYRNPEEVVVCNVSELQLLGTHNHENVMAAVAMAAAYGVPMESISATIKRFGGVEHRIEYVCEKHGVAYYNDSKGTNPDAAIKGIQAMNRPTILIGGGYDKDSSYEEWINAFDGKVKQLVLLGATREKIRDAAEGCGFTNNILVDTFEEAVATCANLAEPGDAVLLSPACASWGMFNNFEERGDRFKELVQAL